MASIIRNQPGQPAPQKPRTKKRAKSPARKSTLNRVAKVKPSTAKKPLVAATTAPQPSSQFSDPGQNLQQKRWEETRGLLQRALVDWEKSEEQAADILKETENQIRAERDHLEDLLRKLKAKLEELS